MITVSPVSALAWSVLLSSLCVGSALVPEEPLAVGECALLQPLPARRSSFALSADVLHSMPNVSTPGVVRYRRSSALEGLFGPLFLVENASQCGEFRSLAVWRHALSEAVGKTSWLCYFAKPGNASSSDEGEHLPNDASIMRTVDFESCNGVTEVLRGLSDVGDLLDDPPMACWHVGHKAGTLSRTRMAQFSDFQHLDATKWLGMPTFPLVAWPVHTVDPIGRQHFFVLGPETSGTRLVSGVLAMARGLTSDPFLETFKYNHATAVFHISLPWGGLCDWGTTVPVYTDFGSTQTGYAMDSILTKDVPVPATTAKRFMVDAKRLVRHYHDRGDAVKVILVARDPRQSLLGKLAEHCFDVTLAQAEQSKAFELMLDAYQEPGVSVFCYEDLLTGEVDYMEQKLRSLDVDLPYLDAAMEAVKITNGNTHSVSNNVTECTADMLAYMRLCPNSTASRTFAPVCNASYSILNSTNTSLSVDNLTKPIL